MRERVGGPRTHAEASGMHKNQHTPCIVTGQGGRERDVF